MARGTAPHLPGRIPARTLNRQQRLFAAAPAWFEAVTALALPDLGLARRCGRPRRRRARWAWKLRILQGKVLSVLRLAKATLTFTGGVDYILWKVERHSGVRLEVESLPAAPPLLALCSLSLRLYRRGGALKSASAARGKIGLQPCGPTREIGRPCFR